MSAKKPTPPVYVHAVTSTRGGRSGCRRHSRRPGRSFPVHCGIRRRERTWRRQPLVVRWAAARGV